jgi:integrase
MKQRRQISTWGDVMKLYLPDPDEKKGWPGLHGVDPRTAKNNAWAMGKILKDVLRLADADKDKDSQKWARAQAENSSKSIILQARSIFNKGRLMVQQYEKHGLIIPPCIEKFLEAKLNGKDQQRAMYLRPADHVIKKTFEEIEKLRDTDREVYLLFWLACGCGLRRGEALRSRWEYFVTRDGKPWFDGGVGKDGEHIKVPVQDRAWAALEPVKKENGPVIESESLEAVRRVGFWLDMQGWKTEKKMHELRAYIGSLIYQVDHMAAMKFMRHKSIKVTEKFYVRYGGKAIPTNVL